MFPQHSNFCNVGGEQSLPEFKKAGSPPKEKKSYRVRNVVNLRVLRAI